MPTRYCEPACDPPNWPRTRRAETVPGAVHRVQRRPGQGPPAYRRSGTRPVLALTFRTLSHGTRGTRTDLRPRQAPTTRQADRPTRSSPEPPSTPCRHSTPRHHRRRPSKGHRPDPEGDHRRSNGKLTAPRTPCRTPLRPPARRISRVQTLPISRSSRSAPSSRLQAPRKRQTVTLH